MMFICYINAHMLTGKMSIYFWNADCDNCFSAAGYVTEA